MMSAGLFAGEQGAAAAEARGDFIGNQQHVMLIAERPGPAQELRCIKAHAAGPLHDRFEDDGGDLVMVRRDQPAKRSDLAFLPGAVAGRGRRLGEVVLGQYVCKEVVHPGIGIADRHGTGRVAMIAAPNREHLLLVQKPLRLPVLDRHFHGDFDAHGTRIAEEHLFQGLRGDPDQP